jgi:hypothetical protein
MTLSSKDASLSVTRALPNGAATVTSTAIDVQNSTRGDFVAPAELVITAPALATGVLANAATMTFNVIHSANADLSSPATIAASVLVQTGAGGAGAPAAVARFRLPTNVRRYVGLTATNSGAGNASAQSVTMALQF